ncbi:MAG: heme peroxidase family protein [Thioalkalispiraceae bacterium]|jgi:hypothetical protein
MAKAKAHKIYVAFPGVHHKTQMHGISEMRGAHVPHTYKPQDGGRFGRMFACLPPHNADPDELRMLGQKGGELDETGSTPAVNDTIPAGFVFFGQFIDHDITLDTTSSLERQNDPMAIRNFRTPSLDLDCVYGSGPDANPFLYDQTDSDKLLFGTSSNPDDLQRNSQGVALIGDPRNDENLFVSQLQLTFIKFHNAIVDYIRDQGVTDDDVFETAQRLARWHYQWIITNEFLPLTVGQEVLDKIWAHGRKFYTFQHEPFIPIEFSGAAYRFGHSQVREAYTINDSVTNARLFELGGFKPVAAENVIDWSNFFRTNTNKAPQSSLAIDGKLSAPLFKLPFVASGDEDSLATRNLLRGLSFGLPSGQSVAKFMGLDTLNQYELDLEGEAPLWYYILKESEIQQDGERLGEVGGHIVAEVLLGLMQGDKTSYHFLDPCWTPELPDARGDTGSFTMADLIHFALS